MTVNLIVVRNDEFADKLAGGWKEQVQSSDAMDDPMVGMFTRAVLLTGMFLIAFRLQVILNSQIVLYLTYKHYRFSQLSALNTPSFRKSRCFLETEG